MSQIQENDATNQDILNAINGFANHTEERFVKIDDHFTKIEGDIGALKGDVKSLQNDVKSLQKDNIHFKNVMVTKEYLDDKLFNLRGDLVTMIRKEDTKVTKLVSILSDHNVISAEEAQQVMLVTN